MISASNYACPAAIRELLKRELSAEGFESATFGSKSEEFGVIGNTPRWQG